MKPKAFTKFLRNKVAQGQHYFLKKEAMDTVMLSSLQFNTIASRFAKENLIKHLSHGFFTIISDTRSHWGVPDIPLFLDKYMEHINVKYYVSLLEAAAIYGSSHHQSQIFQVITEKPVKNLFFDRATILFHSLAQRFASADYKKTEFSNGSFNIASIEQICVDLVTFYKECGYLDNVTTIIAGLYEKVDANKLRELITHVKTAELQRLGYILEFIHKRNNSSDKPRYNTITQTIKRELSTRKVYYTELTPFESQEGVKDKNWKLIINDTIEPDL